jgi:hypothetical protein
MDALAPLLAGISAWAQENPELMKIAILAIGGLATAIISVNAAMKIFTILQTAATAAQTLFNLAMNANPIVLATTAIVAIGAAVVLAYKKFEPFRNIIDSIGRALKTAFTATVDAIKTGLTAYVNVYKSLFNLVAKAWNATIGGFGFEVPSWVPGLGGKGFKIPEIPELAQGGIVTAPTLAVVGEAGPEAVIPLDRMGMMGNQVTINVNGGDPQSVVDALRRYMITNGTIPIRVAA